MGLEMSKRGCIALKTKLHPKTKMRGGVIGEEASEL